MLELMVKRTLVVVSLGCCAVMAAVSCTTGATPMCGDAADMCDPGFDGPLPEGGASDAPDAANDSRSDAAPDANKDTATDTGSGTSDSSNDVNGDVADASKG
jgi:hypothetical protein